MSKKTSTKERIIYGLVAVFMLVSTVGMYIGMILSNKNPQPSYPQTEKQSQEQQERLNKLMAQYQKQQEYVNKIGEELSVKYYPEFKKYKDASKKFNKDDVKTLTIKDLKVGSGAQIKDKVEYQAYYIGWLADGKVFDSSFVDKEEKLKAPLEGSQNLIAGWLEGVKGMKIGGIRQISIPSDKAYGNKKQGDIPANSPLKFIIMAIEPMTKEQKDNMPKVQQ